MFCWVVALFVRASGGDQLTVTITGLTGFYQESNSVDSECCSGARAPAARVGRPPAIVLARARVVFVVVVAFVSAVGERERGCCGRRNVTQRGAIVLVPLDRASRVRR